MITLDSGALIALDRGADRMRGLLARALSRDVDLLVPAPVVAQVWRDGARQALTARLLGVAEVVPLDDGRARRVGHLLGRTNTADIADAAVALCALERGQTVITSDPQDIRRVAGSLRAERP